MVGNDAAAQAFLVGAARNVAVGLRYGFWPTPTKKKPGSVKSWERLLWGHGGGVGRGARGG